MAQRPRVSYGCAACRKRKIKCDEAKPTCSRCARTGSECVYRHTFDILHHDQNQHAEASAQRKWRQRTDQGRTTSTGRAVVASAQQSRNVDVLTRAVTPSPGSPLRQDWQELAFMRFRYDFLDPPNGMNTLKGTLETVPRLFVSLPPTNTLVVTVIAVSFANYAARTRDVQFFSMAQAHYVRALKSLRQATFEPAGMPEDETLLAAHILALYEVLSKPIIDETFPAHIRGTESIMERITRHTTAPQRIRAFVDSGLGVLLLKHALLRHLGYYKQLPPWLQHMILGIPNERIQSDLIHLACEAVDLCARIKRAQTIVWFRQSRPCSPVILLDEFRSLCGRFKAWKAHVRPDLHCRSFGLHAFRRKSGWVRELFNQRGAPREMDVPLASWRSHEWNIYRTVLLNLQCCVLDLVETMEARGWIAEQPIQHNAGPPASIEIETSHIVPAIHPPTHDFTPADSHAAVETALEIGQALLRGVPHILGVQPPSSATLTGHYRTERLSSSESRPDPDSSQDLRGLRGYHLFWPLFNLLKSFTRPSIRLVEITGMESWTKRLLHFLWLDLGIAQAEGYRRWYEDGLPAGF